MKLNEVTGTVDINLLNSIKEELEEDLDRYDGDYGSWSEIVLDHPSSSLEQLLGKIPEDEWPLYHKEIRQHIRSLNNGR